MNGPPESVLSCQERGNRCCLDQCRGNEQRSHGVGLADALVTSSQVEWAVRAV